MAPLSLPDGEAQARAAAESVARHSYGKLLAMLAARLRNLAAAEDALAEAFAAALVEWPERGVPRSPEAWLLTVARRRGIDADRRRRSAEAGVSHLQLVADELAAANAAEVPDERLSLMFACAHPALAPAIRAPLILQTILGFDAATIGSAFLVSPTTMAQRLVRAKRKIQEAGIPFRVPQGDELATRLDAVLEAIYAAYAEGWADPSGTDPRRRNLAEDAIWLGRLVAELMPQQAEALGLLSLMLHAQARRQARRDARGEYIPLAQQDPQRWEHHLIEEAEALLLRASRLPGSGRFQLEAAVQSAHSMRCHTGKSDWPAIACIYEALWAMTGSPVVALNRAIAVAETSGPAAGLRALADLGDEVRLTDYQPYWAARAGLLAQTGALADADAAYVRAIGLESDPAVRRFLERRRAALGATQAASDASARVDGSSRSSRKKAASSARPCSPALR